MRKDEFIRHITYNDVEIDLGIDDYGQTYFIEYIDKYTGELITECVGAYCTNWHDYIEYRFGIPEKNCEIYDQEIVTDNEGCSKMDKGYCCRCPKRFSKTEYTAWQKRNQEFAEWLNNQRMKGYTDENDIT